MKDELTIYCGYCNYYQVMDFPITNRKITCDNCGKYFFEGYTKTTKISAIPELFRSNGEFKLKKEETDYYITREDNTTVAAVYIPISEEEYEILNKLEVRWSSGNYKEFDK